MNLQKQTFRPLFFLFLLLCLLSGLVGVVRVPVQAAPLSASFPPHVVISEFRTTGPNGVLDEFIEIFNATPSLVDISQWKINASTNTGTTTNLLTIPINTTLLPGQYYLVVNAGADPNILALKNVTYSTNSINDNGGIALINGSTVIDAVGLNSGSVYKEGTTLPPLSGIANQSYERKNSGCTDTDNNSSDFNFNQTTSNPQNLDTPLVVCPSVINVTSSAADGVYVTGNPPLSIQVTFNTNVAVTGVPQLVLETGATDRVAIYSGGDGTTTLTFNYTIQANDVSGDLDYVSSTSLVLNGGTVTSSFGNVNLFLPAPGTGSIGAGSLGVNKNIIIDNQQPPRVIIEQATTQSDPTGVLPVNYSVVFSEQIDANTFSPADITQNGTALGVTWNIVDSGNHINFTLSAISSIGAGTIIPSIAASQIQDVAGFVNTASVSTDNSVTYSNAPVNVKVNQASNQDDPTKTLPINFIVKFSEQIDVNTFTPADITQTGTATGITWKITNPKNDLKTFNLSVTALTSQGTIIPSILINKVTDLTNNTNLPSSSTDNIVTYSGIFTTPTKAPTLTRTPTPILGGVIISEVAWMGTLASTNDEWVELYNGGVTTVDLSNWTLKSTDGSINITFQPTDTDHWIDPGEFFILARAGSFFDVVINKEITASFDNAGKSLQLRNNAGVLIDTANSDGGSWPAGIAASPTFATMERHSGTTLDKATNWYTFAGTPKKRDRVGNLIKGTPGYKNWATSVTSTPLPPATPTITPFRTSTPIRPAYVPPPLIGINEFVPRPGHDWNNDGVVNVGDEYIEIINHGVNAVNLSGYSLDDEANVGSPPYRLPAGTLKPGERMVFYGKTTGLLLGDGGDGVRLLKSNGQLADAYNYDVVKYPDQSYCRLPDDGGLDDWSQNCFPTPGLKNSLSGNFARPPTEEDNDQPLCPISDILPIAFAQAECPSFGNIWSRFYWDAKGWFGEKNIPDLNSKWDVYVD